MKLMSKDVMHDLLDGGQVQLSDGDKAFAEAYPQDVVYVSIPAPVTPLPSSESARNLYEAIHEEATRKLDGDHPFRDYPWMWQKCNEFRETEGTYYPLEADRLVAGFSMGLPVADLIKDCSDLVSKIEAHLAGIPPSNIVSTTEPLSERVLCLCLATNHINLAHLSEAAGDFQTALLHARAAAASNLRADGPKTLRADYHYIEAVTIIQIARLSGREMDPMAIDAFQVARELDPDGSRLALRKAEYNDLEILEEESEKTNHA